MEKKMTTKDIITAIELIDKIFGDEIEITTVKDDVADKGKTERETFDAEFVSRKYGDRFAGAVSMVMAISTITDIPLNKVFDMYVEKMREELESDDTNALMNIGKLFLNTPNKKGER